MSNSKTRRIDFSRFSKFRLRTLFVLITVAAITIAISSYLWQKRFETRQQRDAFAALTLRAESLHMQLKNRVESIHGLDFNSYYGGGMLAAWQYFENPYFDHTAIFNSRFGEKPAWKVELHYYARMSDYPNKHLVIVEYGPSDQNFEWAKFAKTVLSGEKTIVKLQEMEKGK